MMGALVEQKLKRRATFFEFDFWEKPRPNGVVRNRQVFFSLAALPAQPHC